MSQCSNFWAKLERTDPLQFVYRRKPLWGVNPDRKDSVASQAKNSHSPEHQKVSEENQISGNIPEIEPRKLSLGIKNPFSEIIRPLNKSAETQVEISASLCGRLYEDFNNSYIWKTKSGLPPTLLKITSQTTPSDTEKFIFQIYLVDAHSQDNIFYIVQDGIKGQTRKAAANGFCQFKSLKLNCINEGEKRKMLILVHLTNPDDPTTRTYIEAFISPEIQVFSENGKVIQIQKLEQFKQYFQLFDPDVFQKSVRRTEGDLSQFYAYILKKNPKIKNLLYIVFKFPEIVGLYYNSSLLPGENPQDHLCELIFSTQDVQEASQLNLVSNYLNPNSKLIIKFNCPPDELKFIINKDFTAVLSVLVGDLVQIPDSHKKLQNDVKQTYIKYYKSITESSDDEDQEELEDQEEEQSLYKELNDDQQSDQEAKKQKSNSKQKDNPLKQKKRNSRGNHKSEDSSYTNEDNREEASDLSLSNKRVRRNAYTKWLERSKKEKLKEKIDGKQSERAQNLMKPPQRPSQLYPVIPMLGGMPGFPQPQQMGQMQQIGQMPVTSMPAQPQMSYVMVADPKSNQMNLGHRMMAPMGSQPVSVIQNPVSILQGGMQPFQTPTNILTGQPQIFLSSPRLDSAGSTSAASTQSRESKDQPGIKHLPEQQKPKQNVQWIAQPTSNGQTMMVSSSPHGMIMGGSQVPQHFQGQFIPMQQPGMPMFGQPMANYGISGISQEQFLQGQPQIHVIKSQEGANSNQNHSKSLGVETRNQKNKHNKQKQQQTRKPQQPSFMIQANSMSGMAGMGMPGMAGFTSMGPMSGMGGMASMGMAPMTQMASMAPMGSLTPMASMAPPGMQLAGQPQFMLTQNGMQLMGQPSGPGIYAINPGVQMISGGAQQLGYPYMNIIRPNDRPS